MKPLNRLVHDFSSATIKHIIEEEFYKKVGKVLAKGYNSTTIITGPDYKRHINNYNKYIKGSKLTLCEIDSEIFSNIYLGVKTDYPNQNIKVELKSIAEYGSFFIDADATCISDISELRKALLKQIDTTCCANRYKAFIFSFSLRNNDKPLISLLNNFFGLLGDNIVSAEKSIDLICKGKFSYIKNIKLRKYKGRVKDYLCYNYNAGGGPMLTCLILYK